METEEERKFARMSLLDHSDSDEEARLISPKTRTPSVRTQQSASTSIAESHGQRARPHSQRSRDPFADPDDAASQRSLNPFERLEDSASQRSSTLQGNRSRGSSQRTSSEIPTSNAPPSTYDSGVQRRRGSSLSARYEGDETHRPLDIIRRESQKANRAPHLRKKAHHGPDIIDKLAGEEGAFHHEGPYDVASLARNRRWKDSPLAAVQNTNREALKSVHREKVIRSLQQHKPLDGFAFVPPGIPDQHGRVFHYEEGTDMMRFNGADYRRWPGIDYHPDDLKGKGEPYFSIDRALKASSSSARNPRDHRRIASEGGAAVFEMSTRPNRTRSLHHPSPSLPAAGSGNDLPRPNGMRRRMGDVKRRPVPVDLLADDEKDDVKAYVREDEKQK